MLPGILGQSSLLDPLSEHFGKNFVIIVIITLNVQLSSCLALLLDLKFLEDKLYYFLCIPNACK